MSTWMSARQHVTLFHTFPTSRSLLHLQRHRGQLGPANHTVAILVKLLEGFDHIFRRHDTLSRERVPRVPRVPLLYPDELHLDGWMAVTVRTHGITITPHKVQVHHRSKRSQTSNPLNLIFQKVWPCRSDPPHCAIELCSSMYNGNKRFVYLSEKTVPHGKPKFDVFSLIIFIH